MASAYEIVEKAMINLVLDFPVYAQMITRIGYKLVRVDNNQLAWTDGKAIYLNETQIDMFNANPLVPGESGMVHNRTIGQKEVQFILCHELLHLIGLTFDRGSTIGVHKGAYNQEDIKKWRKWNKATDFEINALLHTNESTDPLTGMVKRNPVGNMPTWVLYESEYKQMSAEEIFKALPDEQQDPNKPSFDGNETGNNVDGLDFGLDEHMPFQTEDVKNEVMSKIAEALGSKTNGLGESSIDRLIEKVYKPEPFNWRKALTKYIRGWMKENYTWNRPSRVGIANGLILPSAGRTPKMHIAVSVDTSGSICDKELNTMMNHLFTILNQFKEFRVDVWCCGSYVYPETLRTFTASNKKELYNFEFKSDGGNDMRKNFSFLRKHYKQQKPDLFICMSDFYDPLDGDTETTSPCPVIWMVLDNPNFKKPTKIRAETYPFIVNESKNY